MTTSQRTIFSSTLLLLGLAACGGGGGGGSGPSPVTPPSNLVYLDDDRMEVSGVEIAPLLPTVAGDVDLFSVVPALPAGLVLDPATGVIAGTPTGSAPRRVYTVSASNAGGAAVADLVLRVVAAPRHVYATSADEAAFTAFAQDIDTGALTRQGQAITGGAEGGPERLLVHPSGRFAFAPNGGTGNVTVFKVDPSSGWLAPRSTAACGAGPHALALDPSGSFLCVTNRGSDEIYVYAVDPTTGDLTQTSVPITTGTQPSTIEFAPESDLCFATMRGRDGDGLGSLIQIYRLDAATGTLSPFNAALKLNGGRPISLCVDPVREVLYVTLEAFECVLPVRFSATSGVLVPVSLRPVGPAPVAMGVDPRGRFNYVVSQGSDTIDAFHVDPTTGALTYFATYGTGVRPTSIAIDPTGRFAYVSAEGSRALITYAIDQGTGALAPIESRLVRGSPSHVAIGTGVRPNVLTARAVHVTGRASNDVTSYHVDPSTGGLAAIGVLPTGLAPAGLALDPRGRFAWVANEAAHTISSYSIDATTGALTGPSTTVPIGGQPTSVTVDPAARYLYAVAHDVVAPDDGWLSTFAIDGGSGALTPIGTTQVGLHPSAVGLEPTGRFLYTANSGTSIPNATSISVFRLAADTGLPTLSAPPASAPGVIALGFHPSGRFAYGVLFGADTIAAYDIDPADGALTIVPPGADAGPEPVALAFSPDGRFGYVAARDSIGGGNLGLYGVGPDGGLGGALQLVSDGVYPSGLALDPSGRFLWATNGYTDNLTVATIDRATGEMTVGLPVATGVDPSALAVLVGSN